MGIAFVCAKEDDDETGQKHPTVFVMKRCARCDAHAVAGYWCDLESCQHEDTDPEDQLVGHGPGRCEEKKDPPVL